MKDVFAWVPLIWTSRIFVLVSLWGATLIVTLYLARFLRPRHLKRLVTADLPIFRKIGGEAEVLGQKVSLSAEFEEEYVVQLKSALNRLGAAEGAIRRLETTLAASLKRNEE
jgi:hypothetical protein